MAVTRTRTDAMHLSGGWEAQPANGFNGHPLPAMTVIGVSTATSFSVSCRHPDDGPWISGAAKGASRVISRNSDIASSASTVRHPSSLQPESSIHRSTSA